MSKQANQSGYVILHPNGFMELDYFDSKLDYNKYDGNKPLTRDEWMKRYRPECTLHMVNIILNTFTKVEIKVV